MEKELGKKFMKNFVRLREKSYSYLTDIVTQLLII